MRNFSLVYYHDSNENNMKVYEICTKQNFNIYDCNTKNMLNNVISKINPDYIIIDSCEDYRKILNNSFLDNTNDTYIYIVNSQYISLGIKNMYFVENIESLQNIILCHHLYRKNIECTADNIESDVRTKISQELYNLSFRMKLKGANYLTELVYMLYKDDKNKKTCTTQYTEISRIYDISLSSIERAIRFSIISAYKTCKNKQLFFDISKTFRSPSVKEIAYFILDKINIKNKITA